MKPETGAYDARQTRHSEEIVASPWACEPDLAWAANTLHVWFWHHLVGRPGAARRLFVFEASPAREELPARETVARTRPWRHSHRRPRSPSAERLRRGVALATSRHLQANRTAGIGEESRRQVVVFSEARLAECSFHRASARESCL